MSVFVARTTSITLDLLRAASRTLAGSTYLSVFSLSSLASFCPLVSFGAAFVEDPSPASSSASTFLFLGPMVRGVGVDGIGTAGNVRLLYGNDEGGGAKHFVSQGQTLEVSQKHFNHACTSQWEANDLAGHNNDLKDSGLNVTARTVSKREQSPAHRTAEEQTRATNCVSVALSGFPISSAPRLTLSYLHIQQLRLPSISGTSQPLSQSRYGHHHRPVR